MIEYVRVRDLSTGHHVSIPVARFDPVAFEVLDQPATHTDGTPLPPTHRRPLGEAAPTVLPSGARRRRRRRITRRDNAPAETATSTEES